MPHAQAVQISRFADLTYGNVEGEAVGEGNTVGEGDAVGVDVVTDGSAELGPPPITEQPPANSAAHAVRTSKRAETVMGRCHSRTGGARSRIACHGDCDSGGTILRRHRCAAAR